MSRPVIRCDRLSKRYVLGEHMGSSPPSLREVVARRLRQARGALAGSRREGPGRRDFWALKDVSFDVAPGEVVGLIGRNGAGKSTLLKVLSRIVEPTSGSATLRGRVASLLEVGTGFHPELTGRENIYMNGTILGMRKAEIDRKFDAIVDFSEIEEFLDTPVKRYSSGMYVRLAFAVAAHLEPEILIVDEVLAVGDAAFQKKCLGKMQDVASGDGRTILFVSHNMGAMAQLCGRGILLEHGRVVADGPIRDSIERYLRTGADEATARAVFAPDASKPCQYLSAEVLRQDGGPGAEIDCDEPFRVRLVVEVREPLGEFFLGMALFNAEGTRVLYSDSRDTDPTFSERLGVGRHTIDLTVPARLLAPSTYALTIAAESQYTGAYDHHFSCCQFTLRELGVQRRKQLGVVGVLLPWEVQGASVARATG